MRQVAGGHQGAFALLQDGIVMKWDATRRLMMQRHLQHAVSPLKWIGLA